MYNKLIQVDHRNLVTAYVCVPYHVGGFICIGQSESYEQMTVSQIRNGQALFLYKTAQPSETEQTPIALFDLDGMQWGVYERTKEEIEADYVEPETQPTQEERIAALEAQLASYEAAFAEGVSEGWA